jgi:hypothetical protein
MARVDGIEMKVIECLPGLGRERAGGLLKG